MHQAPDWHSVLCTSNCMLLAESGVPGLKAVLTEPLSDLTTDTAQLKSAAVNWNVIRGEDDEPSIQTTT